jgi:hypothetical protein
MSRAAALRPITDCEKWERNADTARRSPPTRPCNKPEAQAKEAVVPNRPLGLLAALISGQRNGVWT